MRLVDIDDIRVMKFLSEEDDPSESDGEREYRNGWNDALTAINDIQPSAEPVRMKGRWETDSYGAMDDGEYLMTRCTSCGSAFEYGHNLPYCGYCGSYNGEPPEGSIGEE